MKKSLLDALQNVEKTNEATEKNLNTINGIEDKKNIKSSKSYKDNGRIYLKYPEGVKDEWSVFFNQHGITLTSGIACAVEFLMQNVKDNKVELGISGIKKII